MSNKPSQEEPESSIRSVMCDNCFQPITTDDKQYGNYSYTKSFNFHVTCPATSDPIEQIIRTHLKAAWLQKRHNTVNVPSFDLAVQEAKSEILQWISDGIGPDDREHDGIGGAVPAGRNMLRQEIRNNLGLGGIK